MELAHRQQVGGGHPGEGSSENFSSSTYLIQVLLFLLHSNFAPFGLLLPPLRLFLSLFLVRDLKSPLPSRGGLEQKKEY